MTRAAVRTLAGGWGTSYVLLALLWGCSFLFIATALRSFAPVQVAGGRIVVGLVLLLALLAVRRELPLALLVVRRELPRVSGGLVGHVAVVAAAMTEVPFVLFALAEQRVSRPSS